MSYTNLPNSSFILMPLMRVESPRILWARHRGYDQDLYWKKHAYCAPIEAVESPAFAPGSTINGRVERYGGEGASKNGGGVRCAEVGDYVIKGVGTNALACPGSPYYHRYGGANIRECIREVVWGDVFDSVLPFGAIRSDAVLDTGVLMDLQYPNTLGVKQSPRVLMLRKIFPRLGHFLRASSFRTCDPTFPMVSDVVRSRNAMLTLKDHLQHALGSPNDGCNLLELINSMYARFALQISTARAKRLIHTALSASNISIDGRFADYGMSTAAPDHGRLLPVSTLHDAWNQEMMLQASLNDLIFFVKKYVDVNISTGSVAESVKIIVKNFRTILDDRYRNEILKLTGLTQNHINGLGPDLSKELFDTFFELISAGSNKPFKLLCPCDDYVPSLPRKFGKYHLGDCITSYWRLRLAQLQGSDSDRSKSISSMSEAIPNSLLREQFLGVMNALSSRIFGSVDGDLPRTAFFAANAIRLNSDLSPLHYQNLNRAIDECGSDSDLIEKLVSRITGNVLATSLEASVEEFSFDITGESSRVRLVASAASGVTLDGVEIPANQVFDTVEAIFRNL